MKRLSIYLMCGPDTPALAEAAVEGGADLLELGFPFSDPLADGPVIRLAAERALAQGMRTGACLECLAAVRARVEVPLIPMTYTSLLEAYGYERFARDAAGAGASSLIAHLGIADLPTVRVRNAVWFDRSEVVRATATGVWYPAVEKMQTVAAGTLLGRVRDPFGKELQEVKAPFAGEVLYVVATPPVSEGEPLAFVGHLLDGEPRP